MLRRSVLAPAHCDCHSKDIVLHCCIRCSQLCSNMHIIPSGVYGQDCWCLPCNPPPGCCLQCDLCIEYIICTPDVEQLNFELEVHLSRLWLAHHLEYKLAASA